MIHFSLITQVQALQYIQREAIPKLVTVFNFNSLSTFDKNTIPSVSAVSSILWYVFIVVRIAYHHKINCNICYTRILELERKSSTTSN